MASVIRPTVVAVDVRSVIVEDLRPLLILVAAAGPPPKLVCEGVILHIPCTSKTIRQSQQSPARKPPHSESHSSSRFSITSPPGGGG